MQENVSSLDSKQSGQGPGNMDFFSTLPMYDENVFVKGGMIGSVSHMSAVALFQPVKSATKPSLS